MLKESIYSNGMGNMTYMTKVQKFDDKLCFIVLPTILFYCYSPIDLDLFIYTFDSEKKWKQIVRTHIYNETVDVTKIHLLKKEK